jgi:hypothetical protein
MSGDTDTPLFVGFGHRRRVGKDTLAHMVRDELAKVGVRSFRDAFAFNLKKTARQLFGYAGLQGAAVYEREPERREVVLPAIGLSPRDLWIKFGDTMRGIAPDVWIRSVLDNPSYGGNNVVLVSDVRYPNEVEAIRARGGMVVKVTRKGIPESDDVADSALAAMPDESWDMVVRNDGDLNALAKQAGQLVDVIRCLAIARLRRA